MTSKDVENLSDTIKPKSDQLNADDLLTGPITVTIKGIRRGNNEQPVIIEIDGHMPYKPCKSMRRVLVTAWGDNGLKWVGRSMTLFCDPTVKFGGVALGGIRISHLSNIQHTMNMMLTTSRAKKSEFIVNPLQLDYSESVKKYKAAENQEERDLIWSEFNSEEQAAVNAAFVKD